MYVEWTMTGMHIMHNADQVKCDVVMRIIVR